MTAHEIRPHSISNAASIPPRLILLRGPFFSQVQGSIIIAGALFCRVSVKRDKTETRALPCQQTVSAVRSSRSAPGGNVPGGVYMTVIAYGVCQGA